jgi:hypothetical protein
MSKYEIEEKLKSNVNPKLCIEQGLISRTFSALLVDS